MRIPKTAGLRLIGGALVFALGLRVYYLFARYVFEDPSGRFRVESAVTLFVLWGLTWKLTGRRQGSPQHAPTGNIPVGMWPCFCVVALVMYWPALGLGFLSDDYVLAGRAYNWWLGPASPILFRPVPSLIWAALLNIGAGAPTLHLLNVLLHGTNGYLAARVMGGWLDERRWALLAGLLVVTAPLSVEAVAWCSGVFDVLATTFSLLMILTARGYASAPTLTGRLTFLGLGVAALASKETAAVAVGLVLTDSIVRGALTRKLALDSAILTVAVATYSVVRFISAAIPSPPVTKYLVQRLLFGTFGSLATPWHADVASRTPILPVLEVAVILSLFVVFFSKRMRHRLGLGAAATALVFLPILPVWMVFYVGPDLQGARYLYLPTIGWALLLTVLAAATTANSPRPRRAIGVAVLLTLSALSVAGTFLHLRPWTEAASLRAQVEASALQAGMTACGAPVSLNDLPDSVRGAYVFRNGASEAFAKDLGLVVTLNTGPGPCAYRWSKERRCFLELPRP